METQISGPLAEARSTAIPSRELDAAGGDQASAGRTSAQLADRLRRMGFADLAEDFDDRERGAISAAKLEQVEGAAADALVHPHQAIASDASSATATGYAPLVAKPRVVVDGTLRSYESFARSMEILRAGDEAEWREKMEELGLVRTGAGEYRLHEPVGRSALERDARGSSASLLMGGLGFGTTLGMSGDTLRQLESVGALTGAGASSRDAKHLKRLGAAAGALAGSGIISTDGAQHHARRAITSAFADSRDAGMIRMLGNESIPIEDLIFQFLAYMSQKYEDQLREKMQETALAEKMERRQEQRTSDARKAGAMISTGAGLVGTVFGPLGGMVGGLVGKLAGEGIETAAQKANEVESAVNGGAKSSTLLANEVQVLLHKWKQLTELLSNVIRTMHDMAMTPIRNIRS